MIINLPATYPARPIPGVLISGFVALDLDKAVYPARYLPVLKQAGYQVDVDAGKGRDRKAEFLADLHCALKVRKQVADMLWEKEEWDLFMFTVTGTDRLQHFLYDAYADERPSSFTPNSRIFSTRSTRSRRSSWNAPPPAEEMEIVALSDHGFGPIASEVYLNPILKKYGFFSPGCRRGSGPKPEPHPLRGQGLRPGPLAPLHPRAGEISQGRGSDRGDREKVREDLKQLFESYEVNGRKGRPQGYFTAKNCTAAGRWRPPPTWCCCPTPVST